MIWRVSLQDPFREISVADLAGATAEARFGADTTLDDAARDAFRRRIAELDDLIDRADRAGDDASSATAIAERDALGARARRGRGAR